ncbi:metallo-beta-lactamase domain-containing protein 1 [Hetaerina americana]|uniref:metallo-beta-lactamase domain-containing protein 1 n=1 Tax=Hetaerina americana TaxID=62018 RepID=UPI003A7F4680
MPYEVHVISTGYSNDSEGCMYANSTCTLLIGRNNIVVDTLNPWSKDVLIAGLEKHGLSCDDINFLVCTHGHSDHVGNNNLFLRAKHVVGYDISFENCFYEHDFKNGKPYVIDDDVQVISTPGHTHADVSVIVQSQKHGVVAVTGDLFEREEDLINPSIWQVSGGSEQPKIQESYRAKIIKLADYIIPGHGPMFKVTEKMKNHIK